MTDFGLFTDDGCVELQFYSEGRAAARRLELIAERHGYGPGEIWVAAVCDVHDERQADSCEECAKEYEESPDE